MLIRKPYAFLIKKFRLIHLIIFAIFLYLFVKIFSIYTFYNGYVGSHTYVNNGHLASDYINGLMYFLCILISLFSFIIYYILSLKKKSNKLYLFSMFFPIILIVYFIWINSSLTKLETVYLNIETVMAFRDISLIILLPSLLFVILFLSRGFGFNLKQFDFKHDLEELQIEESDSEEYELTLGNNTYKIARFFRKSLRLFKYFALENKLFVIVVSSVLIFSICLSVYIKTNVYTNAYSEQQRISANGLSFRVNESYITNTDYNNKIISNGKYYVLINITIENLINSDADLSRDLFQLETVSSNLFPSFTYSDKFIDIGKTYTASVLKGKSSNTCVIVFEIPDSDVKSDYLFKIKNESSGEQYKEVVISPRNLIDVKDNEELDLNDNGNVKIDFKDTVLKNSVLSFDKFTYDNSDVSYALAEKFNEKYQSCENNVCKDLYYSVITDKTNSKYTYIMELKTDLTLDSNSIFYSKISNVGDLLEYFGYIDYEIYGVKKNISIKSIKNSYKNSGFTYLMVPDELLYANNIKLIILIRGQKYTIYLN